MVIVPTVRLPIVELLVLGSLLVDPALSVGDASLPVPLVYDLVLDLLPPDLVLERALSCCLHQDVFVDDYDVLISTDIYLERMILILVIHAHHQEAY